MAASDVNQRPNDIADHVAETGATMMTTAQYRKMMEQAARGSTLHQDVCHIISRKNKGIYMYYYKTPNSNSP
jgi:hypothetical protein